MTLRGKLIGLDWNAPADRVRWKLGRSISPICVALEVVEDFSGGHDKYFEGGGGTGR
jgi:hypothetical protein